MSWLDRLNHALDAHLTRRDIAIAVIGGIVIGILFLAFMYGLLVLQEGVGAP